MTRFFAVVFGFLAAMLTALITLFWVGGQWASREIQTQFEGSSAPPDMSEILGVMAFAFEVAPALTLIPPLVAVILGEVLKIRSALYYVAAGGLAATIMPLVVGSSGYGPGYTPSAQYLAILATAGFSAGLVYWLIAGRRA